MKSLSILILLLLAGPLRANENQKMQTTKPHVVSLTDHHLSDRKKRINKKRKRKCAKWGRKCYAG